jgi:alkylhydroperoxidase/carboxymuconolactone decarboxylase family protein YurZ
MLRLFEEDFLNAFELFHPLTDQSYGPSTLQSVKQRLIAVGILDYGFSPAIDR